ncbi:MAG: DUF4350 domain-containing protein [Paludibaculum sp.]
MRSGLSLTDRRLLIICGVAAVLCMIATSLLNPTETQGSSAIPTTYSTLPGGAQAAYLLLQDLGHHVERREEPLERIQSSGENSVLILAEPTEAPTAADRAALSQFVGTGATRSLLRPRCGGLSPRLAHHQTGLVADPPPLSVDLARPLHPRGPRHRARTASKARRRK